MKYEIIYPAINNIYSSITGIEEFEFSSNKTHFNSLKVNIISVVFYLTFIFSLQKIMISRKPFILKWEFRIHNFFLTIVSLVLLLAFLEQTVPSIITNGLFYSLCDRNCWTSKIELLHYINYMSKYYELLDTVFLVLRKKKLGYFTLFILRVFAYISSQLNFCGLFCSTTRSECSCNYILDF